MNPLSQEEMLQRQFKQFAQNVMEGMVRPIHALYIDVECLKDYNLSTLFTMMQAKDVEFAYIREKIPEYQSALDTEVARYFPDLGYTEEQIKARRNDPAYTDQIAMMAPITSLYLDLVRLIPDLMKCNRKSASGAPPTLYLNLYGTPEAKCQQSRILLTKYVKSIHAACQVVFLDKPFIELPEEFLTMMDIFLFWNLDETMKTNAPILKRIIEDSILMDKIAVAVLHGNRELLEKAQLEDLKESIRRTEALFTAIFSKFNFVTRLIPMETT